jgi:hypothetical protein
MPATGLPIVSKMAESIVGTFLASLGLPSLQKLKKHQNRQALLFRHMRLTGEVNLVIVVFRYEIGF